MSAMVQGKRPTNRALEGEVEFASEDIGKEAEEKPEADEKEHEEEGWEAEEEKDLVLAPTHVVPPWLSQGVGRRKKG